MKELFEAFDKYFKAKKEHEPIGLNLTGSNEKLSGIALQAEVISQYLFINY